MQFPFLLMTRRYIHIRQYNDKTLLIEKNLWMRASLEIFAFSHSKPATSISYSVGTYDIYFVSETYFQVSNYICIIYYTINAVSFYYLWYSTMYKRQYNIHRPKNDIVKIYVYASERSERAYTILDFYIIKVLFLSIWMGRNNHKFTNKHRVWFWAGKSLNMPPTFVILL